MADIDRYATDKIMTATSKPDNAEDTIPAQHRESAENLRARYLS
jgi:hypothetical protein